MLRSDLPTTIAEDGKCRAKARRYVKIGTAPIIPRIKFPMILPMNRKEDCGVSAFRRHGISYGSPPRRPISLE